MASAAGGAAEGCSRTDLAFPLVQICSDIGNVVPNSRRCAGGMCVSGVERTGRRQRFNNGEQNKYCVLHKSGNKKFFGLFPSFFFTLFILFVSVFAPFYTSTNA